MINGLRVPFLVLHGDVDGLCNIEGSRLLKRDAIVEDKELIEFSGKEKNYVGLGQSYYIINESIFSAELIKIILNKNRCCSSTISRTSACSKSHSSGMC